jgi:hypothetical protein
MATKQPPSRVDELLQRANGALITDATRQSATKLEQRLQPLAAELLLEWLVGEKRFESQSQQTEYWISRFYEEIFIDEQPDVTRIYSRFGIPLARASYVARLLRARATTTWRKAARVELKKRLNDKKASALQEKKDGQAHIIEYDIGLSTGAADELRVMYDRIVAATGEAEQPKPPRAKPSFGGLRWVSVPAETLLLVLDQIVREGDTR